MSEAGPRMRVAILCNGRDLALWQARAVERIARDHDILLLTTDAAAPARRRVGHALYYALNLVTVRNRLTRRVAFPDGKVAITAAKAFTPRFDGAWAVLPDELIEWIGEQRVDAIVKFGLNLLRIPPADRLQVPILSYHHGDPRRYRGRPAGFYEMLAGESVVGQVVQVLSNRLDAGQVVAFAESRLVAHSYHSTLVEAYALSPLLLPNALRQVAAGRRIELLPDGPNHRLPGNATVVRLLARMAAALARRLAYGLLVEKRWRVSSVEIPGADDPIQAIAEADRSQDRWQCLPVEPPHSFHADGFFLTGPDDILVEALNRRSGKGELLRLHGGRRQRLEGLAGHASYPFSIEEGGRLYVIPEIVDWSAPAIFEIDGDKAVRRANLDIEPCRILDPTLVRHDGRLYLFGNSVADGTALLHLWSAPGLFGRFERHSASPVRVSVRGSRMAGEIARWGPRLYRLGQDWRGGYGDGIVAFEIVRLTATDYEEVEIAARAFTRVRGPHTLNRRGDRLLFDWYEDRVSPLAGLRRIAARL